MFLALLIQKYLINYNNELKKTLKYKKNQLIIGFNFELEP